MFQTPIPNAMSSKLKFACDPPEVDAISDHDAVLVTLQYRSLDVHRRKPRPRGKLATKRGFKNLESLNDSVRQALSHLASNGQGVTCAKVNA